MPVSGGGTVPMLSCLHSAVANQIWWQTRQRLLSKEHTFWRERTSPWKNAVSVSRTWLIWQIQKSVRSVCSNMRIKSLARSVPSCLPTICVSLLCSVNGKDLSAFRKLFFSSLILLIVNESILAKTSRMITICSDVDVQPSFSHLTGSVIVKVHPQRKKKTFQQR